MRITAEADAVAEAEAADRTAAVLAPKKPVKWKPQLGRCHREGVYAVLDLRTVNRFCTPVVNGCGARLNPNCGMFRPGQS